MEVRGWRGWGWEWVGGVNDFKYGAIEITAVVSIIIIIIIKSHPPPHPHPLRPVITVPVDWA